MKGSPARARLPEAPRPLSLKDLAAAKFARPPQAWLSDRATVDSDQYGLTACLDGHGHKLALHDVRCLALPV